MDNKTINKRNTRKLKTKGSHSSQYETAAKSTATATKSYNNC